MLLSIYQAIRRHILNGSTPDLCFEIDVRGSMIPQLKIKFNVRHNIKNVNKMFTCKAMCYVPNTTWRWSRNFIELCRVLRIFHQNIPFQLKR
jgi:hypothetical protein